ncbi:MAG: glycosyltransferase [Flavobacteriaceae bacterium]
MKIGFDAKRIFHNTTGLGNYGRDVVRMLHDYEAIEEFILYNTRVPKTTKFKLLDKFTIKYPQGWFWRKFPSLWRLGRVTYQAYEDDVDLYHGLSGELPRGLKKKGIASLVTIHDLIFLSHPHYYSLFDRVIYTRKFLHAVRKADTVIAISEQTKRDVLKYSRIAESKVKVVYQGCNDAYKKTYGADEKMIISEKYGLPEKFILNVGTLQERKNALTIVKAVKDTDYHLVIVGNEKRYAKRIHHYISKNNLGGRVTFLTGIPVKELAIIYQLATVFCYPSVCEGFGIPIIEALYSKIPVITSKGSCFPEAGGPQSLYIEPHDVIDLRNKLNLLFNDEKLRLSIIEKGTVFVQKFNDSQVSKNIFATYQNVLEKTSYRELVPSVKQNKISALLITFNEITHIDAVIKNLSFADEIIVVDSYSTDGTIERIKSYPHVKLIQRAFKNYTDQKSFALDQASYDWVLFNDADERVTRDLKNEILEVVNSDGPTADAYHFFRTFMFQNQVLRYSGWQSDKNYRLFKKSKVHFTEDRIVHETLVVNGESSSLKNKLIHYSYKNYHDYKSKMIKYGQMKAQEELKKGVVPNFYHFALRPLYKFLNHYLLRLGILDGKKGLVICYLNALGVFSRYQELKKLRRMALSR